jgi:hypothetical protein
MDDFIKAFAVLAVGDGPGDCCDDPFFISGIPKRDECNNPDPFWDL